MSNNFKYMIQSILTNFIISVIEKLPLSLIKIFAGRYVAGVTADQAINVVKKLNSHGFSATLDILGEHSTNEDSANYITQNYIHLYTKIKKNNLDCNISIKPTHLGLDISFDYAKKNIKSLIDIAKVHNNFLRIDMENSSVTDDTIKLYNQIKDSYLNVGIVLQAYLHRTMDDLKILSRNNNFNLRLCKGIYKENNKIAIQNKEMINKNFISLLKFAFKNNIYIAIATHDLSILKTAYNLINEFKVPKNKFEFQVLYGVPMHGWLTKHLNHGYKVRVYVPYGSDWYDYSMRRLKENPNIAKYIIKNIFRI